MHQLQGQDGQCEQRRASSTCSRRTTSRCSTGRGRLAGPGRVEVTPAGRRAVHRARRPTPSGHRLGGPGLPGVEFDGKTIINSDDALTMKQVPALDDRARRRRGRRRVRVDLPLLRRRGHRGRTAAAADPAGGRGARARNWPRRSRSAASRSTRRHPRAEGRRRRRRRRASRPSRTASRSKLEAEVLLVAVGRRPADRRSAVSRAPGSSLDERGFVEVDAMMRTGEPGVYAIGDLLSTQALAHVASHEGIVAVEHAAGRRAAPDRLRQDPLLHLLPARGRLDRPERGGGPRARPRRGGREVSRSPRSARPRSSTTRAAS